MGPCTGVQGSSPAWTGKELLLGRIQGLDAQRAHALLSPKQEQVVRDSASIRHHHKPMSGGCVAF